MAGSDPRFNATAFRDAIRFAMVMGTPQDPSHRVTFRWVTEETFTTADPAGNPYLWDDAPATSTPHADVQIDCAVEFSARPAGSRDTPLGQFDTSKVILTVLDEDMDAIDGASLVIIDENTYDIQFKSPPMGLFEVTIHQIHAEARDEA